ncbi:MAG: hypothetical protein HDR02_11540 [Lachnospiraceae bacterium]|nr:hypothetical protein [Lachnospiraceae bacterium]
MAEKKAASGNKNKNLLLYVAAIGALLMILVYVFVFQKLTTEAEAIETSNKSLSQRVNQLKGYYDNRENNLSGIQMTEQLIDELLAVYPADARDEDAIMLAVQMQQGNDGEFLSINVERGDAIHVVSAETVSAAASEKYTQEIQYRELYATYVNEVGYPGLKSMIQTIYDSNNRIGIQNIAFTKGDTENPKLSGHIDLVFYSVTGTGKEYVAPDIVPYIAGTDNIFGEIVIPEESADNNSVETENTEGGEIAPAE